MVPKELDMTRDELWSTVEWDTGGELASGAYPAAVLAFEFLLLTACRSGEVRYRRRSTLKRGSGAFRRNG